MLPYPSPILFHGPGARATALTVTRSLGRLLGSFGDAGLKIADSREIVELMASAPVGTEPGVVLVGPLDLAGHGTTDVLLKSIEDFDPRVVRPVLWANDETEVSPTIRSRCLRKWCPGSLKSDEDLMLKARSLIDEAIARHRASVIEILKDEDPRQLLEGVAEVLSELPLEGDMKILWETVRSALCVPNVTSVEVLSAFLLDETA